MVIAPIAALLLFVYFQLYLQALIRTIVDLRENFDFVGKGRLYPWLITLVDENEVISFRRLERTIIALSLWWLLPSVLLLFFLLSIKNPIGLRQFELLMLLGGTAVDLWFWRHYEDRTRSYSQKADGLIAQVREFIRRNGQKTILVACISFFPLYIGSLIPTSWFYVDLHNQVLITEAKAEYGNYLADLANVNLQNANLFNAVLKRANLRGAILNRAQMEHVNLESTDLSSAQLQQANLRGANVKDAVLEGASLREADLRGVQNLTINQLLLIRTGYHAVLDEPLKVEFQREYRLKFCQLFEVEFPTSSDCDQYKLD